ncbi:glycosylase [Gimesia maris]|uniref:glycosylase n=2 Tax=Gimesia maris TaxID=122 RepID=UPI0030D75272|tara:strand:+ start:28281 stop:29258 length:978 start_codon:yes stop_codon:yes gene_type:complete
MKPDDCYKMNGPTVKFYTYLQCSLRLVITVLFCGISATLVAEEIRFPEELTRFQPYASNPIFEAQGPGHWDVKIRERGWILKEGDFYHLWFTGYDGTREGIKKLGYAWSCDGIHWTRSPCNPIYQQHWVEDMMVIKHGDTYHMFAEGKDDIAHHLTSTDAVNWTRVGALDVRTSDGKPIAAGPYGTPVVWHEKGTWYLFYERRDAGIWLATSPDMKVWTNINNDKPVMLPGPESYDQKMIAMNQLIKYQGTYYMIFHGTDAAQKPSLWTTNIAASKNMIDWVKYSGNPLTRPEVNQSSGLLIPDANRFRFYTMHNQVDLNLPVVP